MCQGDVVKLSSLSLTDGTEGTTMIFECCKKNLQTSTSNTWNIGHILGWCVCRLCWAPLPVRWHLCHQKKYHMYHHSLYFLGWAWSPMWTRIWLEFLQAYRWRDSQPPGAKPDVSWQWWQGYQEESQTEMIWLNRRIDVSNIIDSCEYLGSIWWIDSYTSKRCWYNMTLSSSHGNGT